MRGAFPVILTLLILLVFLIMPNAASAETVNTTMILHSQEVIKSFIGAEYVKAYMTLQKTEILPAFPGSQDVQYVFSYNYNLPDLDFPVFSVVLDSYGGVISYTGPRKEYEHIMTKAQIEELAKKNGMNNIADSTITYVERQGDAFYLLENEYVWKVQSATIAPGKPSIIYIDIDSEEVKGIIREPGTPQQQRLPLLVIISIGLLVLLLISLAIIFYRRRKEKRLQQQSRQ
jgi:hypothetical protein